eukprot:552392_1
MLIFWLAISINICNSVFRQVEKDRVCVSESSADKSLDGMYEWIEWDSQYNGSLYAQSSNNAQERKARCKIDNVTPTYTFKIEDCSTGWDVKNNDVWTSDSNMIVTNCQDICITGNTNSSIDGIYKFNHFDATRNS